MNEKADRTKGRCFCGSIGFEIAGEPEYVAYCHCEDCRRSTGAPVVAYSVYLDHQVHFTCGDRKIFESAPGVHRTFCDNCGTPLSYEAEWEGETVIGIFVGTLNEPDRFPPEKHSFDIDRISWFDVDDHLPHYHQTAKSKSPVRYGPAGDKDVPKQSEEF
jgi:hypothetical protein